MQLSETIAHFLAAFRCGCFVNFVVSGNGNRLQFQKLFKDFFLVFTAMLFILVFDYPLSKRIIIFVYIFNFFDVLLPL